MSEIRKWLESIGLGEYGDAFEANKIDMDLLGEVDDQILKDIGMSAAGDRLRIRKAIAKLAPAPVAEANLRAITPTHETTAASAERRQLTVMFCDLVGSTALSARLDPEDLRGIITAYHRRCTELVERNGGFVAKYMGDGVLAYFGYPQAHEHDAERAVRAGLNLVEAVPKLATNAGSPLQVRIGIATGLVVVGDLIGVGAAQEQAVVGETPNLAARLQTLAEPDAVVIAASTRRLTGGLFDYRDLGATALKGFAENVPAWQVMGASAIESRFEAMQTAMTPLVGRNEEVDLLLRRWEQAKGGDGQVVLISGEPGIGKSRIAETILQRLSSEPYIRLRYFCSPHHQDSAFYPSIAQLERAMGFRRDDADDQRLDKLEAVLAQGTNDLSEAVPLLADLLSIPTGDRYPPLNLTPQKRKEKTLHAQLAQVEGLSAQQPVLMAWEDVHWSDPTTRESLDLLVDRVSAFRVLVIITFRPEFAPPWIGRPHVTMLNLNRLPPRQRAEMISSVVGGKALPKEIADQIVERTDGIPLFIEELTKAVIESGVVAEAGDHYKVVEPLTPLAIPTSLHGSLLARLDRLAPVREVAQIAAAVGRSFSHELINAVAGMSSQKLDNALDQLVASELIFRRGMAPDCEYTFKHAMVQDAAYSTLLRSRRQQLHAQIGRTLEEQFADIVAREPEVLARHFTAAALTEPAVLYWRRAGQQANDRSAHLEATRHFNTAIGLLKTLPDTPTRTQQELALHVALGAALIVVKGHASAEVEHAYLKAHELSQRMGDTPELVPVLFGLWRFYVTRAQLQTSRELGETLLRLARHANDPVVAVVAHYAIGASQYFLGELPEARRHLEDGIARYTPENPRARAFRVAQDPGVACQSYSAWCLWLLGFPDQALARAQDALALARNLSHPFSLAFAQCWLACVSQLRRDARTVLKQANVTVTLTTEQGFPIWTAMATSFRGWALAMLDKGEEGVVELQKGIAAWKATGAGAWLPFYCIMEAEAFDVCGRAKDALQKLDDAQVAMEKTEERWCEAEIYRLRGALLLRHSIPPQREAENWFQRALDVAGRQRAKSLELRSATSLARLWRDQGKRTDARALLAPIYGWFTEGFDTPVLQEAKTLLDQLT
jgi:predicted ATPase/class 3 adenylate cyclase